MMLIFCFRPAIVHAQFELSLHPFKDGNGRIGRILIPLFRIKNQLSQPMFYLSEYSENHRERYYQRLKATFGRWRLNGWLVSFYRLTLPFKQPGTVSV